MEGDGEGVDVGLWLGGEGEAGLGHGGSLGLDPRFRDCFF